MWDKEMTLILTVGNSLFDEGLRLVFRYFIGLEFSAGFRAKSVYGDKF